ncbi:hypothetical protein YC2023_053696 [Brassica napus]
MLATPEIARIFPASEATRRTSRNRGFINGRERYLYPSLNKSRNHLAWIATLI